MGKVDFTSAAENLRKRGYTVTCFETAKEAAEYLAESVHGKTVGFGGSVTLDEMGLYELLSERNAVYWHHRIPEGRTRKEILSAASSAEVYFSSVNGLAETGEIINIDGNGNRVASTLYGHDKVYLVVGENKLAPDYDSALYRARNVASPKNAQRLNRKTPCAVLGDRCYDCDSPDRICRGLTVLWRPPTSAEFEVILVGEALGY